MKSSMLVKISTLYLLVFLIMSIYYFVTVAYKPVVSASQKNQTKWMYDVTVITIAYVIFMIFLGLVFRLARPSHNVIMTIVSIALAVFYIVYFTYIIQGCVLYDESMIDTLVPEFQVIFFMFIVAYVLMAYVQFQTGYNVYKSLAVPKAL